MNCAMLRRQAGRWRARSLLACDGQIQNELRRKAKGKTPYPDRRHPPAWALNGQLQTLDHHYWARIISRHRAGLESR